jgi:ring-1,2-phenylacetyl-CoA epoxidase subunit PaaD
MTALAETTLDPLVQQAWQVLESLTDPEIPVVTLRDMGIVREVLRREDGLEVIITPTYSGCPAMGQIEDDVRATVQQLGVPVRITTRLSPAWTTDWMNDAAREKLRAYGIAPPQRCAPASENVVQFAPRATLRLTTADHPACPHCGSSHTTEVSHFGSTACKALYKCLSCLEPFDYFKPY